MTNSSPLPGRDRLATPIQYVKGVGPRIAALFDRKGIRTVEDALFFLPRTYEDRRRLKRIAELVPGGRETGLGEVLLSGFVFFPRMRKKIFEAVVGDGSGTITLKWFHGNPRYLSGRFRKGQRLLFSGEVKRFQHQKEIHHPDVELVEGAIEDDSLHFKRIVPIYSEIEGRRR
jgi:ATP-dependent DNA helicase RecG